MNGWLRLYYCTVTRVQLIVSLSLSLEPSASLGSFSLSDSPCQSLRSLIVSASGQDALRPLTISTIHSPHNKKMSTDMYPKADSRSKLKRRPEILGVFVPKSWPRSSHKTGIEWFNSGVGRVAAVSWTLGRN
jgi:hypothetical protein